MWLHLTAVGITNLVSAGEAPVITLFGMQFGNHLAVSIQKE